MPGSDLDLLINAAHEAGEIARKYWREDPTVWHKDDGAGPVSEADFAVDRHLRESLLAARPDYGWLSEETEDDKTRLGAEKVFIVDPIDGTRSFVAGERTWAHSLAIAENGVVTAGVVFLPVHDKLFSASLGAGAHLNQEPISASLQARADGATVLAPKPSLDPAAWPGGLPQFKRHFRPSLAYRLALVGQGRFDTMITLREAWEWDIAAGCLIATEAGAKVSDSKGLTPEFNRAHALVPGLVVAGPNLHDDLVARLTA
ncbi:MAG: 3'(2'),5'-bisphosphate nucleotidase CysQ [Rhodobacteraceae bacterium]|nr:3'(2'),5'-bisphosphate nucleotidase CysQ [Paracoccaceae bacterium]